jgi:hypothetical protein
MIERIAGNTRSCKDCRASISKGARYFTYRGIAATFGQARIAGTRYPQYALCVDCAGKREVKRKRAEEAQQQEAHEQGIPKPRFL